MIVTLTPNPSIDRTITLPTLAVGGVNRASAVRQDPGGKGVNVSRALAAHGEPTTAVAPLGGAEGDILTRLLEAAGVPVHAHRISGSTRLNLTLAGTDGITTKVNEPGSPLGAADVDALVAACTRDLVPGSWLLGAGSLPPGTPGDLYVRLVEAGRRAGAHVAVDSSGEPFLCALAAAPDLIKPNHHELGEALGREMRTLGDVVAGARELTARGVGTVVVSLGRSGAVAVTNDEVVHAAAGPVRPVSTVGAGDALLAGFLLARTRGGDLTEALCLGIRFGTAAVTLDGSLMPAPHDIAGVSVTPNDHPDLDAPVEE